MVTITHAVTMRPGNQYHVETVRAHLRWLPRGAAFLHVETGAFYVVEGPGEWLIDPRGEVALPQELPAGAYLFARERASGREYRLTDAGATEPPSEEKPKQIPVKVGDALTVEEALRLPAGSRVAVVSGPNSEPQAEILLVTALGFADDKGGGSWVPSGTHLWGPCVVTSLPRKMRDMVGEDITARDMERLPRGSIVVTKGDHFAQRTQLEWRVGTQFYPTAEAALDALGVKSGTLVHIGGGR